MIVILPYVLDTLVSLSAGVGLKWYLGRNKPTSVIQAPASIPVPVPADYIKVIHWLESIAAKSEVMVRREGSLLLAELKTLK